MPKIVVTDSLVETLKMLRTQNSVKSKDLAEYIGKTPGYITKLEKKELKNIELETVERIFEFLLGDSYKSTEAWERIYASLQINYSKKDIDQEIWFCNYDTVYRHLPIPTELICFINDKLSELNLSRDMLLARINANESLSQEDIEDESIKFNVWYPRKDDGGASIKIKLSIEELNNILDGITQSECYVFVFCILFYTLKFEVYHDIVEISDIEYREIYDKTTDTLNSYKFYSIPERDEILSRASSREEVEKLLTSFDNENFKLIQSILTKFKIASDLNIRTTHERLAQFSNNVNANLWFTLKLISLNYQSLAELDIAQRKEFVKDVEDLINSYVTAQKKLEDSETY